MTADLKHGVRRCFVALLFFLFLGAPMVLAAADPPIRADRLVRAMQLDRAVLLGMLYEFDRAFNAPQSRPPSAGMKAFHACVLSIDSEMFVATLADALGQKLSNHELDAAIEFYESPAGKSYAAEAIKELQEGVPQPSIGRSKEEQEAVRRFAETPAGNKLFEQSIVNSPPVARQLLVKWNEALERCREKTRHL